MEATAPRRGRPRSETARQAIMSATRDLLGEVGYERVTLKDIAARSGVGRQTLYRWWPSKAALVADCLLEGLVGFTLLTSAATGDAAADLRGWLTASHRAMLSPEYAPLLRALSAAAAADEGAAARIDERFAGTLRAAIDATLREGIATGSVRPDVDAGAVSDLLLGSLMYAAQARDATAADRVDAIVSSLFDGIGR